MSNKSLFVVLMICGLILSALVTIDGQLLLLAMPFLAYLVVGIVQAPTGIKLTASRLLGEMGVDPQERVEAHLIIKNEGDLLTNLRLSDAQFPGTSILEGQPCQRIALAAGESLEFQYAFKTGRGIYTWKSVHAVASDPFGLFPVQAELPAYSELVVRPASRKITRFSPKPRLTLHSPGPVSIALSGYSTDFLGVREYRPGDSLRRLNWRLAARHPHELFTNEYEREEIADFGLILDARKLSNVDAMEEVLFEDAVCATRSLAESFLQRGNRVSLLIFGESMAAVFPGYGKRQINRIVRALARARLGSNLSLGYLEYFPTRLFPSRSILIMLSSVGPQDYETYARLRSFGYDILLISPDPVDYMRQRLSPTQMNSLAARAARLERIIELERIMKLGIQVVDWQVDGPWETMLQKAAGSFARMRRI